MLGHLIEDLLLFLMENGKNHLFYLNLFLHILIIQLLSCKVPLFRCLPKLMLNLFYKTSIKEVNCSKTSLPKIMYHSYKTLPQLHNSSGQLQMVLLLMVKKQTLSMLKSFLDKSNQETLINSQFLPKLIYVNPILVKIVLFSVILHVDAGPYKCHLKES